MVYTNDFNEIISMIIMIVLYGLTYLYITYKVKNNRQLNIFILISIILRIILTITDTYFSYLPNSGADSATFESDAYKLLQGIFSLKSYNFDNYPKLIYFAYLIIGRKPIVIRSINGILSMITGLLIYKSINLITKDDKKSSLGMLIFLLFPHSLIFSSVILRESFIVFFSTFSIYYFIKHTIDGKLTSILKSYIFIIIGALFHAGIIFISMPYIYYILRDRTEGLSAKMKKTIVYISIIVIVVIIVSVPSIFLRKVAFLSSPEALFNKLNSANVYGINSNIGSAYLTSFRVNSFKDLVLYAPLKVFYFLFSPMPWDIRGLSDILAIGLDSIFYIILIPKILITLKELKSNSKKKLLIRTLVISFILVVGVYAMGTIASGTAIRHRYKSLSLIIITLMSLKNERGRFLTDDL